MLALVDKYVGSVVRHGLTALAGILVGYGVTQGQADEFILSNYEVIMGLIAYALGQGLSFIKTKKLE